METKMDELTRSSGGLHYGAGAMTSSDELARKAETACEAAVELTKAACEEISLALGKGAEATDKAIRARPYQAVGIALAIGFFSGVVLCRK